jgi:hypothetical protein
MGAVAEAIEPTTQLEERQLLKLLELFIRLHRSVDVSTGGDIDSDLRDRVHRACVRLRIPLCAVEDDCKEGCGDVHREFVERRGEKWEAGRPKGWDAGPKVTEENFRHAADYLKATPEDIKKWARAKDAFNRGFMEGLRGD